MAVIFPRWTNRIPQYALGGLLIGGVTVVTAIWYYFSPWYTDVGYEPEQPVEFSHELHAGKLGMDCRYCHNTVERGAKAAIPPTATCIGCHNIIKPESRTLEPVRRSAATGDPIYQPDPNDPTVPLEWGWVRVHMLPDYAYFDHSVHLNAGLGCAECHGRVDHMDRVRQVQPLSMSWCLDCHRDPTPRLRPRSEITNMGYDTEAESFDYLKPSTPPEGCQENADCESGFCAKAPGGIGECRPREVNPPINCSGCHR